MPDMKARYYPTDSGKSYLQDLLAKVRKASPDRGDEAGDLLSDEAIEDLPDEAPPARAATQGGDVSPEAETEARLLGAVEAGATSAEDALERQHIDPKQFESLDEDRPSPEVAVGDVMREQDGGVQEWVGGGGWQFALYEGDDPYIMVTDPGSGRKVRVRPGTKNAEGQDVYQAILDERETLSKDPELAMKVTHQTPKSRAVEQTGEPKPEPAEEAAPAAGVDELVPEGAPAVEGTDLVGALSAYQEDKSPENEAAAIEALRANLPDRSRGYFDAIVAAFGLDDPRVGEFYNANIGGA